MSLQQLDHASIADYANHPHMLYLPDFVFKSEHDLAIILLPCWSQPPKSSAHNVSHPCRRRWPAYRHVQIGNNAAVAFNE